MKYRYSFSVCIACLFVASCANKKIEERFRLPVENIDKLVISDELWTLSVASPFNMNFILTKSKLGFTGSAMLTVRKGEKPEYVSEYDVHVPKVSARKFESALALIEFTENPIEPIEFPITDYYPSRKMDVYAGNNIFYISSDSNNPNQSRWIVEFEDKKYYFEPNRMSQAIEAIYPFFKTEKMDMLFERANSQETELYK